MLSSYFPPQLVAAAIRSVISSLVLFGTVTLGSYQLAALTESIPTNWTLALVSGGIAALTNLGARGIGEGTYDSHRNAIGDVQRGDVGATLPAREF